MPRFFIKGTSTSTDGRGMWTHDGQILCLTPGEATTGWQSEKAFSVPALEQLFKDAGARKRLSALLQTAYANQLFPAGRQIVKLSLDVREMAAGGSGGVIMRLFAQDLGVLRHAAVPDNDLPSGVSKPVEAVVLSVGGSGFRRF
jgi:hypothetical protein